MFIKTAKILALGIGAIATTGIPSGTVAPDSVKTRDSYICRGYQLRSHGRRFYTTADAVVKVEEMRPAVVVHFGPKEDHAKLEKAPEATKLPGVGLESKAKPSNSSVKTHKQAPIQKIRVVLGGYIAPPQRIMSEYVPYRADTGVDFYSGVVPRDPLYYTAGYDGYYASMAYSDAASVLQSNDRPLKSLLEEPVVKAAGGKIGGIPGVPPSHGEDNTAVPEPTSLLAILAGLPVLAAMTRRRS